jgi:mono/diheme cytochrome c family protein
MMQALRRILVILLILAPFCVRAQEPGNAQAGRTYAHSNCTQCHALGPGVSPHLDAPTFFALANTPGMTGRALAAALQTSHETMPSFALEGRDRDNIIAYIMSLRQENR